MRRLPPRIHVLSTARLLPGLSCAVLAASAALTAPAALAAPAALTAPAGLTAYAAPPAAPGAPASAVDTAPGSGSSTLARIRARGALRCGGAERPGLARETGAGHWSGLEFEFCRALAAAVLGAPDKVEFSRYESPDEYARVARRDDDVSFLTANEMVGQGLADRVVPGPPVFVVEDRVMVPEGAPEQHLEALAGQGICYVTGDAVEEELNGWFESRHLQFVHHAHSEVGERNDAYGVQHCHAIASESTDLALVRLYRASSRVRGRMLPEVLASRPVLAVTGTDDARWAAVVGWAVHTLVAAERVPTHWTNGGIAALPVNGTALGLDREWQSRMVGAVGDYGAMLARSLGERSPLAMARGPNRPAAEGGAMPTPSVP